MILIFLPFLICTTLIIGTYDVRFDQLRAPPRAYTIRDVREERVAVIVQDMIKDNGISTITNKIPVVIPDLAVDQFDGSKIDTYTFCTLGSNHLRTALTLLSDRMSAPAFAQHYGMARVDVYVGLDTSEARFVARRHNQMTRTFPVDFFEDATYARRLLYEETSVPATNEPPESAPSHFNKLLRGHLGKADKVVCQM